MRLIKIETKGFKSFANRVSLEFDGGVVGIVGPNGSGKSNINDAIKWVLGERSIKSLRGSTSEDIIFAGSKVFPASEIAEVSLTFDNRDHLVSIPHDTFIITRRIERGSGASEYFINGEVAKLKEIEEIAMESGISKSSLAIISQGTVQNIAQASPLERRAFFEEAAGISKYKSKKEEALKKLEKTSESLDKLKAIIYELEKQLTPLKKQAEKAKTYLAKRDELKEVEIGLIVEDLKFFNQKIQVLKQTFEVVNQGKENFTSKINLQSDEITDKTRTKLRLEKEVIELSTQFEEVNEKLRKIEIANLQMTQRRQLIIDGQIQVSDEVRLKAIHDELVALSTRNEHYKELKAKIAQDISEKSAIASSKNQQLAKLNDQLDYDRREVVQLKTKIAVLKDQEENKTHLFKGTKVIIENKMLFPGLVGLVSELIHVAKPYQMAIETVLASSLQYLVVETSEVALKAINFLKSNHAGRSSFIPLSSIRPKMIFEEHLNILQMQDGFLGVASDLVQIEPRYDQLRKFLLGNILVTSTIETAERLARLMKNQYMIVTLDGDLIRPGGVIVGGEKKVSREAFGLTGQIGDLEIKLPELEKTLVLRQHQLQQLSSQIAEEQMMINAFNIERSKLHEKQEAIESQYYSLKSKYESESSQVFAQNDKMSFADLQTLENEKSAIQIALKAKRDSIDDCSQVIAQLNLAKGELEKELRSLIETSSEQMSEYNKAEYVVKTSSERLALEYELTFESAANQYNLAIEHEAAREIVTKIRQEIKELGHVNIDAITSFDEVNLRYEKLKSSEQELVEAKTIIATAINEMDQIIVSKLDETVQSVNREITVIFQKMFGGGHAEVRYIDPNNLLETGIEVIAQPPGKTVKNLNLFSGGEKAMVAISLLFAILKSKPLPLCILDEVEAALDEANVVRFAEYLQELRDQTQFIVITHRIGTMSLVDSLFGATMQTKGVTSFFTVKLEEARKLITSE